MLEGYPMKKFDEWWMPDEEKHLIDWMQKVGHRVDGRLTYQYHKYEAALALVRDNRVAVDIGAHIGLWSYFMARDFKRLEAFEPMPSHQACWVKNMEGRDNVHLHRVALGEDIGRVTIATRTKGSTGDTGIVPGTFGGIDVAITTLDNMYIEQVDFIKIDCEGFEEFVLRGGKNTLEQCKPVVLVEQKGDMSRKYGLEQESAVRYLESLGAKVQQIISGDYILSWA